MDFPQFRKYVNGQSYFMITDQSHFWEYKKEAKAINEYQFEAKILPDRNYISDMLNQPEPYWEVITKEEFLVFLEGFKNDFKNSFLSA